MSWLARSIANTLHLEDEDDPASPPPPHSDSGSLEDRSPEGATFPQEDQRSADSDDDRSFDAYRVDDGDRDGEDDDNQGRGVREDLSELKDTLARQFWGVASFLAPPPPPPPPPPRPVHKSVLMRSESKSDWAESDNDYDDEEEEELVEYDQGQSGQFGKISNLSRSEDFNCTMTTIDDAIGITEEVLAFARNVAHHPETWLDFPLSEEEEFDDFDISDTQYKHALAVEQEAPRLSALRIELCPAHMSDGYFWTVYFVLLHSRLNKHDADLLSSPQIVQARSMWMKELRENTKDESHLIGSTSHSKESSDYMNENFNSYEDTHSRYASGRTSPFDPSTPHERGDNYTEKQLFCEVEDIDKSIINEDPPKPLEKEMVVGQSFEKPALDDDDDDDDDNDDWLKEDSDLDGYSGSMIIGNEEDVSFSDLEDDTDYTAPLKFKTFVTESRTTPNTS